MPIGIMPIAVGTVIGVFSTIVGIEMTQRALKVSGLFPSLSTDLLDNLLSSSAIITCDYDGSNRILLRKEVLDDAIRPIELGRLCSRS